MSEDQSVSPDNIRAIFAEALPITGTGTCYLAGAPTTAVPVITVDAANRPDVLDLGRVVRLEPTRSDPRHHVAGHVLPAS